MTGLVVGARQQPEIGTRGVAGIASSYLLAMTGLVVGAGQQLEIGTRGHKLQTCASWELLFHET
ncbi:MAG: hypothetical protein R2764_06210 [Bacteroidales bacterium]